MTRFKSIAVIGDSILKGVVLNESTGKYKRSPSFGFDAMANGLGLTIVNLSHFGSTIGRGLLTVQRLLKSKTPTDAAIIELGGNDSDFCWHTVEQAPTANHSPNTPLDEFKRLYTAVINELRQAKIVPIICSVPPLCAERYLDWITRQGLRRERILQWLGDVNAIYRYQEQYANCVQSIARDNDCAVIDIRGALLKHLHMPRLFCMDGIHPNPMGQRLILDEIEVGLGKLVLS